MNGQVNSTGPDLAQVVMPLVKLLRNAHMSWDNRETIAGAIDIAIRAHRDMEAEQQHLCAEKAVDYNQWARFKDTKA